MKRRSFLVGLAAIAASGPAIARTSFSDSKDIIVEASNQSGHSLCIQPLQGELNTGDIITIEGVGAFRRPEYEYLGPALRQFVVTAKAEVGHRVIHLYPPIIPEGGRYATVIKLPMNGARVNLVCPAI